MPLLISFGMYGKREIGRVASIWVGTWCIWDGCQVCVPLSPSFTPNQKWGQPFLGGMKRGWENPGMKLASHMQHWCALPVPHRQQVGHVRSFYGSTMYCPSDEVAHFKWGPERCVARQRERGNTRLKTGAKGVWIDWCFIIARKCIRQRGLKQPLFGIHLW